MNILLDTVSEIAGIDATGMPLDEDEPTACVHGGIALPGAGGITISRCAKELFGRIGETKQVFNRGGAVCVLTARDDGALALEIVKPAAARSLFEKFTRLYAWRSDGRGKPVLKPATCPHDMAQALLETEEASTLLPKIRGLVNCPILREVDGIPQPSGSGYDPETKLLITGGEKPDNVSLETATVALTQLLAEFDFQTEGDRARAIASLISPALKMGKFILGRVPADVAEADQSQSGKTYRQKLVAAIYNETVSLVTSRKGGVGSVDESLDQQLIAGRPFIQFDNFRGRFDSSHAEAFLTAEKRFPCRVPHRGEITVDPENFFVLLTSNGVDTTRDFANRSCITRIRKKPSGHAFKKYHEGDLLAHVRENQAFYLGCVFAVIRAWHTAGKLRTAETRHDFREWCQVLDWIVQNVFKTVPLMDGHREAQERVSNPALVWLRLVILAAESSQMLGEALNATDLVDLCENAGITVPGSREGADPDKAKRVIGTLMGRLFKAAQQESPASVTEPKGRPAIFELDSYQVTREVRFKARDDGNGNFEVKTYTITKR